MAEGNIRNRAPKESSRAVVLGIFVFMSSNELALNQGTQEKDRIEAVSRSKQEIRDRVATKLLESGVLIPDPVFHLSLDHFIANFEGNQSASVRLIALPEWQNARRVFITPDRSTEFLRKIAVMEHKEVVVTTYGICRGAVLLTHENVPYGQEEFAASLDGMEKFGKPLRTVGEVQSAGKIDLMVTGALAISEKHGGRTGKGAGWFDAEWIMWRKMDLTTPETPVAGIVHDLQIVPEAFELQPWDSLIQIIATPTQIIRPPLRPQPDRIDWEDMEKKWRDDIPLMRELYDMRVDRQTEP